VRALDSYNTGVQTEHFPSPIRTGEALSISTTDADLLGVADGERVTVSSRRGSITMTIEVEEHLAVGLCHTTFHFPETTDINQITSDAVDPKSGTAEFKAAAVRVDKLVDGPLVGNNA